MAEIVLGPVARGEVITSQEGAMSAIVSLHHVSKEFPRQGRSGPAAVLAVDDVSLEVERGSVLGIVGYSGAGKSTLVRLINGLERSTGGSILVKGQDVTHLSERELRKVRAGIGMIFQQFNLLKSRTVYGNVAYPLKVAGWKKEDIKPRVAQLLDFVGIADKGDRYPRRLSGGQQQRVGIARALANNPDILLADEATSALDPETTNEVLKLLRRVNQEFGTTIIVITHEMHVVREICDAVVMMDKGRVVESGETYSVFKQPRAESTRRFVATAVHSRPSRETLDRLATAHPGRLVTVAISETAPTPVVAEIFARLGIHSGVVFGGVTEIQHRILGSLTYELNGDAGAVDAALAQLALLTAIEEHATSSPPVHSATEPVLASSGGAS